MKRPKIVTVNFVKNLIFLRQYMSLPLKNVTLAVSGGSDSIYLAHVLLNDVGSKIIDRATVRLLHINHNWRAEASLSDQTFVEALAKRYNVPCDVYHVYPDLNGESPELQARNQRKEIFAKYPLVLTGHTADDLYETILWKTLQGRDPGVGIKVQHNNEVRPLLHLQKSEMQDYLKSINETWREDETNHDGKLLRSKMRRDLMPTLAQVFPDSLQTVVKKALERQKK